MLDVDCAAALVAERGLVLESAQGPLPRLVEEIAREPIEGSWWGHRCRAAHLCGAHRAAASAAVVTRTAGGLSSR